jgi:RHS repeat-associated protein
LLSCAGAGASFNYPFLTLKERDIETGLDYFLARYYSSAQGRFTSPDEFTGGPFEMFEDVLPGNPTFYAELEDPQSLNKYHYCLNNPLRYIDPDGHQGTTTDRLKQAVVDTARTVGDFGGGVGRGIVSSFSWGIVGAPQPSDSTVNRAGQVVGSVIEGMAGADIATGPGLGVTFSTGGAALLTGEPEAAMVTGGAMIVGASKNLGAIAKGLVH